MTLLLLLALFAAPPSPQKRLEMADRSCMARLELGDIQAARETCSKLEPADHPIAAYWHALFETDSTRLRALLDPSRIAKLDPPGKRILVLAGRYQFSAGSTERLSELVRIAKKHHPRSAELDTLESLARR